MAMMPLVGGAAQPFWGQLADRTGSRTIVLCVLALGAAAGYTALYFARDFPALLLSTAALAFFSTALIPACFSVTLAHARHGSPYAFGLLRVWGTVGFLLVVVAFPRWLDGHQRRLGLDAIAGGPSEPGLEVMFLITAALVTLGAVSGLAVPRSGEVSLRAERGDWRVLLRHPPFLRLLGFMLVSYLCLQGPMGLFPIYVRAHGGSIVSVSEMWMLMLSLEIPLIALSGASLARFGARGLLAIGIVAGGVRWTVCGLVDQLFWIYAVQILHGVVVAGIVIGAPLYVEAVVPERLRSTGQSLLAMVGMGFGGISSYVSSGWLLQHVGPDAPYVAGGVGALLLGAALPWLLPRPTRPLR
jgi:PPP family 3-phenylpropionic acid transporter